MMETDREGDRNDKKRIVLRTRSMDDTSMLRWIYIPFFLKTSQLCTEMAFSRILVLVLVTNECLRKI